MSDQPFSAANPPKIGDIVQVGENGPHNWFRCLVVVDEIKPYGVMGYVTLPGGSDRPIGDAFMRFEWHEIVPTGGFAIYVPGNFTAPPPAAPE